MKIKIGSKFISREGKPYVIAEIGVNHGCSLILAKKMILSAKKAGADAVKFQSYKAEGLVVKKSPAYWDLKSEKTKSQFALFKKYDKFNINDYEKLYNYCKKIRIDFSTTPFDIATVDKLDHLVKYYKVASSDITNFILLKKIASKKKPILLSTGASTINEIKNAINFLVKNKINKKNIIIMHCILSYPTKDEDANINMIKNLNDEFSDHIIGYSDHTMPKNNMLILTSSFINGAVVIEKHFTFNKKLKGNDHYHAMDENDLKVFQKNINQIMISRGTSKKKVIKSELKSRKFARRSLVALSDIKKNEILNIKKLSAKRPGTGISPKDINRIIGKRAKRNIKNDQILSWKDIS